MSRVVVLLPALALLTAAPAYAGEAGSRDVLSIQRVEMPWTIGLAPGQVPGGLRLMSWTAFRGSEALTAPQFAQAVGDRAMVERLTTERRVSGVLGGVLGIGSAACFIVGGATLANLEQYTFVLPTDIEWAANQTEFAYAMFLAGGALAAFAPAIVVGVHMRQLWVGRYYSPQRAADLVDEHNAQAGVIRAPQQVRFSFSPAGFGVGGTF